MNYSKQIFEMLGIEPNEKFKIKGRSELYTINERLKTSFINSQGRLEESIFVTLDKLLIGEYEIVKLPKFKLSHDEKNILENISVDYNWIIRDIDGELRLLTSMPETWDKGETCTSFKAFNHLFKFIKPVGIAFYIENLLNENSDK